MVATLVRRPGRPAHAPAAVLYLHGFSDYFHQNELAEFHAARGEDFYALDLRKNGRSLLPHQTPARMTDVSDYYPELDAAVGHHRGRRARAHLVINAHSTGGLIARALAARPRPHRHGDLDAGHRGGAEQPVPGRARPPGRSARWPPGRSPCSPRTAR